VFLRPQDEQSWLRTYQRRCPLLSVRIMHLKKGLFDMLGQVRLATFLLLSFSAVILRKNVNIKNQRAKLQIKIQRLKHFTLLYVILIFTF
jgi:hypothetical protein